MKENAMQATLNEKGGVRLCLPFIKQLAEKFKNDFELHVVGHSAGSIFHAPLIRMLTTRGKITSGILSGLEGLGLKINTCTLWAPACSVDLFKQNYLPAIQSKDIGKFTLYTLTDEAEQDDNCGKIYNKSLLYLVSNAFEKEQRIPLFRDGIPILGMQKFIQKDKELSKLFQSGVADHVLAPNAKDNDPLCHSTCNCHGDFDDDNATVTSTLSRMLNKKMQPNEFVFNRSASSLKNQRNILSAVTTGEER